MITPSIKRILKTLRTDKILNKIASGKIVYFENKVEGIAFKCVHSETGKPSRYYAKHYGRDEFEIDFDSVHVIMAVMEGNPISKERYDKYHQILGNFWNRNINIYPRERQWVIRG